MESSAAAARAAPQPSSAAEPMSTPSTSRAAGARQSGAWSRSSSVASPRPPFSRRRPLHTPGQGAMVAEESWRQRRSASPSSRPSSALAPLPLRLPQRRRRLLLSAAAPASSSELPPLLSSPRRLYRPRASTVGGRFAPAVSSSRSGSFLEKNRPRLDAPSRILASVHR